MFERPADLHWGVDGWRHVRDTPCHALGLGPYGVRLVASDTARRRSVQFTWRWQDDGQWSDKDFQIRIAAA